MASWGFLTTHARVLLCIAHDPGAPLRGPQVHAHNSSKNRQPDQARHD
jgi:hypothetical protein